MSKQEYRTYSPAVHFSNPLIVRGRTEPLVGVQECRAELREIEDGYRRRLYQLRAGACATACGFQENWNDWKVFIKDPFWKDWKKKPQLDKDCHKILRYVLMYIFQGSSKNKRSYDRASRYDELLRYYMNNGLSAEDVAARIEKDGGFEKALEKVKKENPTRKMKKGSGTDYYRLDHEDDDTDAVKADASGYDEDDADPDDNTDDSDGEEDATGESHRVIDPTCEFVIEMTPQRCDRFLRKVKKQVFVTVVVEYVESEDDGWHRIRAI